MDVYVLNGWFCYLYSTCVICTSIGATFAFRANSFARGRLLTQPTNIRIKNLMHN